MRIIIILVSCLFASLGYAEPQLSSQPDNSYKVHAVISSETMATISSPMAGLITHLLVKDGSSFKTGDTLLQFDCRVQSAALQKAAAAVKLAYVDKESYARLSKLGSASNLKVAESQAELEKALGDQKIAQKEVDDCQIKAPFSGQITELYIHQNESVQLYQKVFDILDNTDLTVKVLVPSDWLTWLKVGSTFELTINEIHQTYTIKIERIVEQVDAVSQSVKIIGSFISAPKDLTSGMSGDAIFKGPTE